jgi:hypothetical protein
MDVLFLGAAALLLMASVGLAAGCDKLGARK